MVEQKTDTKIIDNILSVYADGTLDERASGLTWYQSANALCEHIAMQQGISTRQAIGVTAILSPGLVWESNLQDAETLVAAFQSGHRGESLPTVGVYGRRNIEKCERLLKGASFDVLVSPYTSPKVYAFYECLASPQDSPYVVIDRHAKCLALGITEYRNRAGAVKPNEYNKLAHHYVIAARSLGLLPSQLQAITWVIWRRKWAAPTSGEEV